MIRPSVWAPLRVAAAILLLSSATAFAQDPAQGPAPADAVPTPPARPAQIDLNLINLPTTMSIARHRSYFRLTHRFASDLRRGDFGDQAADLFSLDKETDHATLIHWRPHPDCARCVGDGRA